MVAGLKLSYVYARGRLLAQGGAGLGAGVHVLSPGNDGNWVLYVGVLVPVNPRVMAQQKLSYLHHKS